MSRPVQINSFDANIPFYPLYLKFASEFFHIENVPDGMSFFSVVCDNPALHANAIYGKLRKIKKKPKGDLEFGRKSFHGIDD